MWTNLTFYQGSFPCLLAGRALPPTCVHHAAHLKRLPPDIVYPRQLLSHQRLACRLGGPGGMTLRWPTTADAAGNKLCTIGGSPPPLAYCDRPAVAAEDVVCTTRGFSGGRERPTVGYQFFRTATSVSSYPVCRSQCTHFHKHPCGACRLAQVICTSVHVHAD